MEYEYDDSPFHKFLGMSLHDARDGRATVAVMVREEFRNIYGVVHGALISAIMDSSGVQSVKSLCPPEVTYSTLNLDVTFLKPARGTHLAAHGEALHVGGRTAVATVSAFDGETPVAYARVIVHMRRPRS